MGKCRFEVKTNEEGSTLVTVLLVIVVLNLLALGLSQTAVVQSKLATYNNVNAEVFRAAESCTNDVIKWLSDQSSGQLTVPAVTKTNITHLYTTSETNNPAQYNYLTRLQDYGYNCTTSFLLQRSEGAPTEAGNEIGNSDASYGTTNQLYPKYYYRIVSQGTGPNGATKTITTIVSVQY